MRSGGWQALCSTTAERIEWGVSTVRRLKEWAVQIIQDLNCDKQEFKFTFDYA